MSDLMSGAPAFRADFYEREGDLMRSLAREGQCPGALFVSCSDSRVVPELIMGAKPGDLFVLRNIGNVVPPAGTLDASVGAVVECAVRHLAVAHVILCGHLDCVAIRLLDSPLDMAREPALARWLEWVRPAQTQVDAQNIVDPAERHVRIVQTNVLRQLSNLEGYDTVREAVKASRLQLHGWVFDIETGQVWSHDPASDVFRLLE